MTRRRKTPCERLDRTFEEQDVTIEELDMMLKDRTEDKGLLGRDIYRADIEEVLGYRPLGSKRQEAGGSLRKGRQSSAHERLRVGEIITVVPAVLGSTKIS